MPKILYALASAGGFTGGQKMVVRHVETLRDLGFEARLYVTNALPAGLSHQAPMIRGGFHNDDILVVPDDDVDILRQCEGARWRSVVFVQNPYALAAAGAGEVMRRMADQGRLTLLSVAPRQTATLRRLFPKAAIHDIRAFADERLFRPAPAKQRCIVSTPKKRPQERQAIEAFLRLMHPAWDWPWRDLQGASEIETAESLAQSEVFLSLNRLESVGLAPLEAMAAGCVVAGFTGIGGLSYATPDNGFWVPDEDCEAAADALAEACALVKEGGPALKRRREAGFETARAWSQAACKAELEAAWTQIAPETRVSEGSLD